LAVAVGVFAIETPVILLTFLTSRLWHRNKRKGPILGDENSYLDWTGSNNDNM
jgi:hypothetical protein